MNVLIRPLATKVLQRASAALSSARVNGFQPYHFCTLSATNQSKQGNPGPVEGNMSGTWYNELGSEMILDQSPNGDLEGIYMNHAPDSANVEERVVGSRGTGLPTTVGFIVNFEDGKYTTSWSGQYFRESSGEDGEVLLTTWIMTANVPDIKEYWEATSVGQDRFTRKQQKPKGRKLLSKK